MNKTLFCLIFIFGCASNAENINITDPTSVVPPQTFSEWKSEFSKKASDVGISANTISIFQKSAEIYEPVIKSDQNQAEFAKFIWEYLDSAVSEKRVNTGKQKYQENAAILTQIQSRFAVPETIVLAIWGMETNYGSNIGNVPLVNSMATLAFEGRRKQFFENQLIDYLSLYDSGDILDFNAKGSWAGAMGHTQFMPSSYKQFGVDFDGDNHRNLFEITDALASTANYLNKMGWNDAQPWGGEVLIPDNFDYLLGNDNQYRSITEWQQLGVRILNPPNQMQYNALAKLFVPAGQFGPKFLLFKNFDVIKKYNNSNSYALAIGLLSEEIKKQNGLPILIANWPNNAKRLNKDDIIAIQQQLNTKGFKAGEPDGIWGSNSSRAVQYYQKQHKYTADGFLTTELYNEIIAP